MKRWILVLLLAACGDKPPEQEQIAETPTIVGTPEQDQRARPLIEQTSPDRPLHERQQACIAHGSRGGNAARQRLVELLTKFTQKPEVDAVLITGTHHEGSDSEPGATVGKNTTPRALIPPNFPTTRSARSFSYPP